MPTPSFIEHGAEAAHQGEAVDLPGPGIEHRADRTLETNTRFRSASPVR